MSERHHHSDRRTGQTTDRADRPATVDGLSPSRRAFLKATGAGAGTLALGASAGTGSAQTGSTSYDLAEALQKSLYFYDANMCGDDVGEQSELIWRGDCHDEHDTAVDLEAAIDSSGTNLSQGFVDEHRDVLDPEGTGTVDVAGGYHDAGDHPKFGTPEGYAASTVAWAVHEFEDAFDDLGILDHAKTHLRRFAEYFLKCTFRDDDGAVVTFCHQVGKGGSDYDHNYWGPAELQTTDISTRPAFFATPDEPAGAATAEAAASLAVISTVFEGDDDEFAAACLDTARALYEFAVEHPETNSYSGPHYGPEYSEDDLSWAAIWLHVATGEDGYLEDVLGETGDGSFTGHISRIITQRSDDYKHRWVHSWDNVWGGVLVKLAHLTDDEFFWEDVRWHLEYWSGGEVEHEDGSGGYVTTTPAGFSVVDTWGSARYNTAAQMTAMVYRKYRDDEKARALSDWALGQMEYIMGDNPFEYSLIVGFTDDHASRPHHDTAHGSISGKLTEPPEHRHTLWGALVGGPNTNDEHEDAIDSYELNEVSIDYNAGFVGALAGLYTYYSDANDETVSGFLDTTGDEDPYRVEARIDQEQDGRLDVNAFLLNESFHPASYEDDLSFRYYMDLSDAPTSGGTPDVEVSITYDQIDSEYEESVSVTGPEPWDGQEGIYYVEFDASGHDLHGEREISFGIANYTADWFDPSTDPSYEGLSGSRGVVESLPVYRDGEHVFGVEPDGSRPPEDDGEGELPAVGDGDAAPTDPDEDGLYEDVNGDGATNLADAGDLFQHRNDDAVQDEVEAYDFSGNDEIDLADVVDLFRENT